MKTGFFVLFLLMASPFLQAAELHGKVVSQVTGEPLSNIAVTLAGTEYSTRTAADGTFSFANILSGKYTLEVSVVGYWLEKTNIELTGDSSGEFEIVLTPRGARRKDTIDVSASVFTPTEPAEVAQMTLTTSELKQTDTVLLVMYFVPFNPCRACRALLITTFLLNSWSSEPHLAGSAFTLTMFSCDSRFMAFPAIRQVRRSESSMTT